MKQKKEQVESGSEVIIKTKEEEHSGTLLTSYDTETTLLKLNSGYNIGIKNKDIIRITKTKSQTKKENTIKIKQKSNLPSISMILTGGTISSKLDYKTGGVKPLTKPEDIISVSPQMLKLVNLKSIESPFNIDSSSMSIKHWQDLANNASKLLNEKENKGLIITHGTDTLHYSSAALSFMLRDLNKPVCFTYSQRSIDRASTDATLNLECAAAMAKDNIAECMIVGHKNNSDNLCQAIRGTKVRKMHTSRRDAFKPVNDSALAEIKTGGKIKLLTKDYRKRTEGNVAADTLFEKKVGLVKYYPGAEPEILENLIDKKYKGIIIEGLGLGHVSTEGKTNWLPIIKRAIEDKIWVGISPQTIYGRIQMEVYSAGRKLAKLGVINCQDMLSEVAYIKLAWVLGHTQNNTEVTNLMTTNIAGEINRKISQKDFLY